MGSHYIVEDISRLPEIGKDAPELAEKPFDYYAPYAAVFSEGKLTEREKALIALAVTHFEPDVTGRMPEPQPEHGVQIDKLQEKKYHLISKRFQPVCIRSITQREPGARDPLGT